MNKRILQILVFINCIFCMSLMSQTEDQLYDEVSAKFQSRFGSQYMMDGFMVVDSNLGRSKDMFNRYKMEDPYRTLNNCVLIVGLGIAKGGFIVPCGFVSIYRNGNFIWTSDTLIYNYRLGSTTFLTITDLNNDGEVEIVVGLHKGMRDHIEHLWIVSWDGQTGTIINDMKKIRNGYESVLVGYTYSFEFVDMDGDGIKEIIGEWYEDRPANRQPVVYRWNGMTYGKHGITELPAEGVTVPRNQLVATVGARVSRDGSGYKYHYFIANSSDSKQEIEAFYIECRTDSVEVISSPKRWMFMGKLEGLIGWQLPPFFPGGILSGMSDTSFVYKTGSLPNIARGYVRGKADTFLKEKDSTGEDFWNDIRNNSFIIQTIGPTKVPDPFIPLNFLDTLSSYTTQSLTLGWIKENQTADKYLTYFSTAKQELEQNNTNRARAILQNVLRDVDIDSTGNLTSEAYALLRYNTEYLFEQIPE